jgi:hypothetical protein
MQYDSPGSPSQNPRTSDETHEINGETENPLFTYLQLGRLQVIMENLEFSQSPLGIVHTPEHKPLKLKEREIFKYNGLPWHI